MGWKIDHGENVTHHKQSLAACNSAMKLVQNGIDKLSLAKFEK